MWVFFYGPLAQLEEHPAHNREVTGSMPVRSTNISKRCL